MKTAIINDILCKDDNPQYICPMTISGAKPFYEVAKDELQTKKEALALLSGLLL